MENKIKLSSYSHNHSKNNNTTNRHLNDHHMVSGLSANDDGDDYEHENQEKRISSAYSNILDAIGEDLHREGLLKTPLRAAIAFTYFTKGYKEDLKSITIH